VKAVLGGILLAVGILIAGASGLCSLYVLASGFGGYGSAGQILSMIPLVLMFGGIPFAAGVGLILGGRALIRSERKPPDYGDTFE
jgi:hypothetical protein